MNFLHQTLRDHLSDEQKAAVLLSATCKGNDPTLPLCPLFHGSLGPLLFSDIGIHASFHRNGCYYVDEDMDDDHSEEIWQCFLLTSNNITWVKHVYFSENDKLCKQICGVLIKTRYASSSIKSVTLTGATLDISVEFITTHCRSVEKLLRLVGETTSINDQMLSSVSKLHFVHELDLHCDTHVTDSGLVHLSTLPSLLMLKVPSATRDIGLDHCAKMTSLRKLDLSECPNITDVGIGLLVTGELQLLEDLDLSKNEQLSDTACMHLRTLPNLQKLNLLDCHLLTDTSLEYLSEINALTVLELSGCTKIGDAGMVHLSKLTCLKTLYLARCNKITADLGFNRLVKLTKLQKAS